MAYDYSQYSIAKDIDPITRGKNIYKNGVVQDYKSMLPLFQSGFDVSQISNIYQPQTQPQQPFSSGVIGRLQPLPPKLIGGGTNAPPSISSQLKPGETVSPFVIETFPPTYTVLDAQGNRVREIRAPMGTGVQPQLQNEANQYGGGYYTQPHDANPGAYLDVYNPQGQIINQDQFQSTGLNVNLLPNKPAEVTTVPKGSLTDGMVDLEPKTKEEFANSLYERFGITPYTPDPRIAQREAEMKTYQDMIMGSLQPGEREAGLQQEYNQLENQLTQLRQAEERAVFEKDQAPATQRFVSGEQGRIRREAQLQRGDVLAQIESKQRALGLEVEKRKGVFERAKTALGFAESDIARMEQVEQNQFQREQTIMDYAFKLEDRARQTFGTILQQFEGKDWEELSPQTQGALAQLAGQAGIPPQILAEAISAQADSKKIDVIKFATNAAQNYPDAGITGQETSIDEVNQKIQGSRTWQTEQQRASKLAGDGTPTGGGAPTKDVNISLQRILSGNGKLADLTPSERQSVENEAFSMGIYETTPQPWFKQQAEEELQMSILPDTLKELWDEFREPFTEIETETTPKESPTNPWR
jgi:hypothetical protein